MAPRPPSTTWRRHSKRAALLALLTTTALPLCTVLYVSQGSAQGASSRLSRGPAPISALPNQLPPFVEPVYKPLFYLKTHKTGSSTIGRALMLYASRHNLRQPQLPGNIYHTRNSTGAVVDAITHHHFVFDAQILRSYFGADPQLTVTSMRLPLQRQLSWFLQQNRNIGEVSCQGRNDSLLAYFDAWKEKRISSQWFSMQERHNREKLGHNAQAIVDQFDYIFLMERMKESYECFCNRFHVRLCDEARPVENLNVREPGCVQQQLMRYRSGVLVEGAEKDMLLYEIVQSRLSQCVEEVPEACRCGKRIG